MNRKQLLAAQLLRGNVTQSMPCVTSTLSNRQITGFAQHANVIVNESELDSTVNVRLLAMGRAKHDFVGRMQLDAARNNVTIDAQQA